MASVGRFLLTGALLGAASLAHAQLTPAQSLIQDKFVMNLGGFIVGTDVTAHLNGSSSTNPDIDFDQTFGDGSDANEPAATGSKRDGQLQLIAGNDVLAELGVIHAAQVHTHALAARMIDQQQRRRLCQRLDGEDCRQQRLAREMSLEEIFVDGDVLERHQPLPRLVLGDRVDEERGKAVGEAFDYVGSPWVH